MTGAVRVSPAAAPGHPPIGLAVAGRAARPGAAVVVDAGEVPVRITFDFALPVGRVRGRIEAVVNVPPDATVDVQLPYLAPEWLRAAASAAGALQTPA